MTPHNAIRSSSPRSYVGSHHPFRRCQLITRVLSPTATYTGIVSAAVAAREGAGRDYEVISV